MLHAGTERDADGQVVTAGGRVLSVVGTGADLAAARTAAYAAVDADPAARRPAPHGHRRPRAHAVTRGAGGPAVRS